MAHTYTNISKYTKNKIIYIYIYINPKSKLCAIVPNILYFRNFENPTNVFLLISVQVKGWDGGDEVSMCYFNETDFGLKNIICWHRRVLKWIQHGPKIELKLSQMVPDGPPPHLHPWRQPKSPARGQTN